MQGNRLKEKEKLCKLYYNEIVRYLNKLESDYKNGRTSYEEHFKKESKFLKGRSEKWWYDYLRQCVVKLRNGEDCHVESPRRESRLPVNLIVIFVAIFGIILVSQYTGFVTFGSEFVTKDVDLTFVNSTSHDIILDHDPVSLKVSGSYSGKGSFRLYLENKGNRLLIIDSSVSGNNLITGNIVANITENITTTIQETTTSILENATTTILENTTTTIIQNATTSIPQNTTTSILDTTTTISENTTSTVAPNTTTSVLQNATTSTSTSILQAITFSDACMETCILTNVSSTIKLIAIIDDGSLAINKISYSYLTEIQQAIESGNVTVNESIKQLPAEISKPVRWKKEVYIKNEENATIVKSITVDIPDVAENIKIDGQSITSVFSGNITYTINTNLQPAEELIKNITYETPPPTVNEENIDNGKRIVISSDIHYEDILAYTNVDENIEGVWNVYWIKEGGRTSLSTTRLDTDNNNKIDRVEWIIPGLSNQTFEVLAESTTASFNVDLAMVNISLAIYGANASSSLAEIATGDINNDTTRDILFSSVTADPYGLTDAGEVYLIYGRNYTDKKIIDLNTVRANITIRGANVSDFTGNSVAFGDINDDGLQDMIIAASLADVRTNGDNKGSVYVIYGSKNYTTDKVINLDTTQANITIGGYANSDELGSAVSSADINNDGIDDIIIGAEDADPPGGSSAGSVFVVYGSRNYGIGKKINFGGAVYANLTIWGANATDNLGSSVATGDVNNDGIKDIIAAADLESDVYIIYGRNYIANKTIDLNMVYANITIRGNSSYLLGAGPILGTSVATGDINGNGITDILISGTGADPLGRTDTGEGYVIYGSSNYGTNKLINLKLVPANITIRGNENNDNTGIDIASGDINKDGKSDIIIGARLAQPSVIKSDAGKVYVIYGSSDYGVSKVFDLSSSQSNITIIGTNTNAELGWGVASAEINNISGSEILMVSRNTDPPGGSNAGTVYMFHGNEVAPILRGNNTVNDTTPFINAKLKCISGSYSDGNYDNLYKSYWKWYHNNEEVKSNKTQEFNLTWISEVTGDLIRCSQKVSDGYLNSSWYNSTPATVSVQSVISVPQARQGGKTTTFERRTVEIITPEPVTLELTDSINVPIKIKNNIDIPLKGIILGAKSSTSDLTFSFSQTNIAVLNPGQELTVNMIIESHSIPGTYAIDINLNVTQPKYFEQAKLFIDLVEKGAFNKTIIVTRVAFAKDLFKENPECLELDELLVRAQTELDSNNIEEARGLTEQAVRGCKDLITSKIPETQKPKSNFNLLFLIILIVSISILTIVYYIIYRFKK